MATTQAQQGRSSASTQAQSKPEAKPSEGGFKGKLMAKKEKLQRYALFRVLESTVEGFIKDKAPDDAAAMTYYGIFSLFPLILLFMSLAGLALQSNEAAREQIMGVIVGLLPQGQDDLRKVIAGVIDAKGAAAGIGLLTLVWSATGWFQVIDTKINEIWGVSKPRSFIKGRLFALAMVAGIGGVALLSFAATFTINLLETMTNAIPGSVFVWQLAVTVVSILVVAVAFFALYRFSPQRHVQFADVWPAALTTAVVWELTRRVLAFYLEKNDMVSGYGPVGAAMALLFWIYVASMIILLGAELTYAIAKERRHIEPEEEMQVVAPPGEQPTAKFAPQVGAGHAAGKDQDEPIRPEGASTPAGGRTPIRSRPADSTAQRTDGRVTGNAQGDHARDGSTQHAAAGSAGPVRGVKDTVLGAVVAGGLLAWRRFGGRRASRSHR